jgi:hypothetical protein
MKLHDVLRVATAALLLAGPMAGALAENPAAQSSQPAATYQIVIDTSETPELTQWINAKLRPVVEQWYPRIVEMLPSDGYAAPVSFSITFRKEKQGVADTSGTRINVAAAWFKRNLHGEARGAVVHEMVHVVQQYGPAQHTNPQAKPNPGWLVEGIADYIRWYRYEPQSHGADHIDKARATYNGSYRETANFLDYVVRNYDKDIVRELNAEMRAGRYDQALWRQLTGREAEDLGAEWKAKLEKPSQ